VSGSGSPHARAHLSIGEVLSLLQDEFPDVTISKIRFLESQGLLDPERTPSGYRKFYDYDIERLRWILRLQKDHYLPLKVIKDRLDEAGGMLPFTDGSELAEIEKQPSLLTTEVPAGPRELPDVSGAIEAPAARAQDGGAAPSPAAPPAQTRAAGGAGDAAARNGRVAVTERDRERGARPAGSAASSAPPAAPPSSRPGSPGPRTGAPGAGRPSSPAQPAGGRAPQDRRPVPGGRDTGGGAGATGRGGAANGRAVPPGNRGPGGPGPGPGAGPGGQGSGGGAGRSGGAGPQQQRSRSQQGTGAGRGGGSGAGGAGGGPGSGRQGGGPGQRPAPRRNPPQPGPARSRAPEPGRSANGVGGFDPGPDAVNLNLDELAEASGLTPRDVRDLERFGLIEALPGGGYDGDALVIARTAAGFLQHGIEARHMRTYKVAVDREAGLFEQIVTPLLKQRNPEARVRATRTVTELIRLGEVMRGVLLRRELRDHIGGG
jgi:DNA-binding transcriptional MerR regulator